MKTIFSVLVFCLFTTPMFATPQEADQLLMNDGTKKSVHNFELSDAARKNLDAWKQKKGHAGNFSTGNYDGFHARLQLKDDHLYLAKLEVDAHSFLRGSHNAGVPLSVVFGKKGPVAADLFSGELREYFGEDVGYSHVKSNVRIYVFVKGRLVGTKDKKSGGK